MKLKRDLLTHTQGLREGLTVAQGGPDAFVGMLGTLCQELYNEPCDAKRAF